MQQRDAKARVLRRDTRARVLRRDAKARVLRRQLDSVGTEPAVMAWRCGAC